MFSKVDRSGDHEDQSSNQRPSVSRKVRAQRAACDLGFSCWEMAFGRLQRRETTTGHKFWEMYQSTFKLSSIRTRDVHDVYPTVVQSIKPGLGSLCWSRMQADDECSPRSLQTRNSHQITARINETRLKRRCCATPVSSFVVRHAWVAFSLYVALSREAAVMVGVLTCPRCCKCHCTVQADTGAL